MSKYINSVPTILGGMPVVIGTRATGTRVLSLLKDGYSLDDISMKTLEGAIEELAKIINNPHATQIL